MTAAGWYPDGAGQVRFWDGDAWTHRTSIPAFDAIGRSDPSTLAHPSDIADQPLSSPPLTRAELCALLGMAGFVVGLASVFLPFLAGFVGGLIGLGLSIVGTAEKGPLHRWAVAGIVVSALAIVLIV